MDDVIGPSFSRLPTWKKTVERCDGTVNTEELQYADGGNDPKEPNHASTQTENNASADSDGIQISEESIKLIERALTENEQTKTLFEKLLGFHTRDAARLQLTRTVPITAIPADSLPVRTMVAGANGRIALLLSSEEHESWCNHNAHVVVCHWNKQFSLPQAVCPTAAAWGNQGILAVATHAGNIDLYHGQQLISSTQVHDGPVTALDWSGKELISCGTDGTVVLLSARGTNLEKEKTIRLSVADLPRQIRRGAPSSRPLGVVSLARFGRDLSVGSETGGIWRMTLPDLSPVPSVATPLAIQKLLLLPAGRMVVADVESRVTFLSPDGSVESDALVNSAQWLFILGSLVVSSNEETITIVDALNLKQLFSGNMSIKAVAAFGIDEIVIINERNELQIYGIVF